MQKNFVALLVILAMSFGCIGLHAEDFIPRATTMAGGSERPVADSSNSGRSGNAPNGSLMSEPSAAVSDSMSAGRRASMRRVQVGVDGSTNSADDTATNATGPAAPATATPGANQDNASSATDANSGLSAAARKHRNAMRWQSLLPGMMK